MRIAVCRLIATALMVLNVFVQTGCGGAQMGGENGVDEVPLSVSATETPASGSRTSTGFQPGAPQQVAGNGTDNDGLTLNSGDSTSDSGTAPREGSPAAPSGGGLLSMPLMSQRAEGGSYPGAYCGPTTCRMVLAYYGIKTTPDEVALTDFGEGPMYRPGAGSTHAGMAAALRHYGLNAEMSYGRSLDKIKAAVDDGHPVIVNLKGNYGPFTTKGHITVVVGFTADGDPIINDSAGGKRRTIPARTFLRCWQGLMIEVSK